MGLAWQPVVIRALQREILYSESQGLDDARQAIELILSGFELAAMTGGSMALLGHTTSAIDYSAFTAWADVDTGNLRLTFDSIANSVVMLGFRGHTAFSGILSPAPEIYFDFEVDGVRIGHPDYGIYSVHMQSPWVHAVNCFVPVILSAGAHIVDLSWKGNGAHYLRGSQVPTVMYAFEIAPPS